MITNPLVTRTIPGHLLFRVLGTRLLESLHLESRPLLPLSFLSLIIRRLQFCKSRHFNDTGVDQRHLVHTVGTPLTIRHRLLPRNTYYGIERECRVVEIILLVRIIVGQIITPNGLVRTRLIHQLRSYATEHNFHPIEVLIPVDIGNLVLIHVEGTNGQRTGLVITRSGDELIFLSYGERTALDRNHTYRIDITHSFSSLKIGGLLIKIIPSGGIADTRVQFALIEARCSTYCHRNNQEILKYVFHIF